MKGFHKTPKPTSGGLYSLFWGQSDLFYKSYLPLFCLPLAITGLIDDRYNISIKYDSLFK